MNYSIIVFGENLVSNIFVFIFSQEFDIHVTLTQHILNDNDNNNDNDKDNDNNNNSIDNIKFNKNKYNNNNKNKNKNNNKMRHLFTPEIFMLFNTVQSCTESLT